MMDDNGGTPLREPLYHSTAIKASSMGKQSNQYLPPHRYDENETVFNIYMSSDEAYATVAKALLFDHAANKKDYEPYDIVIKILSISQIKMFADAHMEKALTLPTFPERDESPNVSLMRRIDLVFGPVLLEFYASKDGILLGPQIDLLVKKDNRVEEKRNDSSEKRDQRSEQITSLSVMPSTISVTTQQIQGSNQRNDQRNDYHSDHHSDLGNDRTPRDSPRELNFTDDIESNMFQYESSFDQIYNLEIEKNNSESTTKTAVSKEGLAPPVSNLRQEILNEIVQIKDAIRNTESDLDRHRYKNHLHSLLDEVDRYKNLNKRKDITNVQLSESRAAIDVDVPVVKTRQTSREVHKVVSFDEKFIQSRGFVHIQDVEKGFKFVRVIAHDNLDDGVLFQANYRQESFTVRVPYGGVKKGQVFASPMLHPSGEYREVVEYESLLDGMEIPEGRWRDDICNCCIDPMLLLNCFCPNGTFRH